MADEGKSIISVVYNIGLVVILATILGLLMGKITDLISHVHHAPEKSGTTDKVDSE